MKRVIIALVMTIICASVFFFMGNYDQYKLYFETRDSIEGRQVEIDELSSTVSQKTKELLNANDGVLKDLKTIMAYISEFDGVEITSIKAFKIDGGNLTLVKNITSMNDPTLCDGYEIEITVPDILGFISYFDESAIIYQSVDLMFGSETVIMRVRTGGGI